MYVGILFVNYAANKHKCYSSNFVQRTADLASELVTASVFSLGVFTHSKIK